jgi:formiminotetrahydrofolate cyclodeaminase
VIKIIQISTALGYNQGRRVGSIVTEFEAWLGEMATKPLPGGVAAAALAAAMGAALAAKAAGVAQIQGAPGQRTPAGQRALPSPVALTHAAWVELVDLAAADAAAYQGVLDSRHLPDGAEARREAWQQATDLPLSLAETCRRLLAELPRLKEAMVAEVAVDLEIGRKLLEAGAEAGILAARENLRAWGAHSAAAPYQRRLAVLSGEEAKI